MHAGGMNNMCACVQNSQNSSSPAAVYDMLRVSFSLGHLDIFKEGIKGFYLSLLKGLIKQHFFKTVILIKIGAWILCLK